jgi:hypothetical protein
MRAICNEGNHTPFYLHLYMSHVFVDVRYNHPIDDQRRWLYNDLLSPGFDRRRVGGKRAPTVYRI